ncbi:rod shape-determining protein RodA [Clostridium sp. MSJ-8]|uniref:FtsW/RodA/SpoVE family cell cycle protein n=1 Tax=Clostridium sp. MSJ-8 TaxID=2841510 RepID=UPI001C0EC358|nr:FtsW/RodA/SpoVE family cell cycle protein [Clostridium sp. MSJ-8]MBU5488937.1 rod shape-determining protein RodA [Clostridium sp. MSJ-8]
MLKNLKIENKLLKEMDSGLIVTMVLIIFYGILNIYIATKGGASDYGSFYFVKKQVGAFVLSMIVFYIFIAIDYHTIMRYVPIVYWLSIVLLITVWIPGIGVRVNGARGWINLRVMYFQPAELAKFGIILMLAKIINEMEEEENINTIKNLGKLLFYAAIPMILIVIQPDMGMTMVCFFIVLGILYIAGLDRRIIIGGVVTLAVAIVIAWNTGIIQPYQKARIISIFNPDETDTTDAYQLNQSLIGIGSGGLSGIRVSLEESVSPGYAGTHVPEVQTDFIFAAIAEQWGLIGSILLLVLYGILIKKMINIAKKARDRFGSLICVGMIAYFIFAIAQNIGMTIGLMPITGITLPLVSYGGSSLLTTVMAVALVVNIGMRKQRIFF